VTDEMVADLLEQLGDAALVELTAFIALANMNARGNVALGIESEGYAASCDLKPLAGRIDERR
jgi:alkylhydroperoxidase family enzyme